jgi:hypothetical protein
LGHSKGCASLLRDKVNYLVEKRSRGAELALELVLELVLELEELELSWEEGVGGA